MMDSTNLQKMPACFAEIDTEALANNYRILKEQAKGAKVMAVIKANAYGHDADIVANALPQADAFGVARLNEASRLRQAGISNRIVVLGGILTVDDWSLANKHELDVVLHQKLQLASLSEFLKTLSEPSKLAIWLKFDTGMHRLGFSLEELPNTVKQLSQLQTKLRQPIVVMSHFANADALDDPFTSAQLASFKSLQAHVNELSHVEYSLCNSSALLHRDDTSFDWARSGLALYGVSSQKEGFDSIKEELGLAPVMSLRSRLIEIKTIKQGEGVGYGLTWQAERDTLVGIASLGYGDGYPREIRSNTPILVKDEFCTIVGSVSMDLIAIDLRNCSDAKVNDSIEAWGKHVPVEVVAMSANTIPYTLLCGISQRVETIVKY